MIFRHINSHFNLFLQKDTADYGTAIQTQGQAGLNVTDTTFTGLVRYLCGLGLQTSSEFSNSPFYPFHLSQTRQVGYQGGTGIYAQGAGEAFVTNCIFSNNTAQVCALKIYRRNHINVQSQPTDLFCTRFLFFRMVLLFGGI